jgi:hypothetical protein
MIHVVRDVGVDQQAVAIVLVQFRVAERSAIASAAKADAGRMLTLARRRECPLRRPNRPKRSDRALESSAAKIRKAGLRFPTARLSEIERFRSFLARMSGI